MIHRSHQKAFSLLLESKERSLNSGEQSFLDEHLKTCPECKAYARLHVRLKRDLKPQAQDLLPAGPPRSITGSGIVSSIERRVKMRKLTNNAWRVARAGLAIVLLGAFLWILFDLLPALTPGSFSASGTPASTENPSLFSNTQPAISSQFVPTTTHEPEPSRTPPALLSPTEVIKYRVQEGDTVFGIAEKFNLNPETILWGNLEAFAENPHLLQPGMELNILPVDGVYHKWTAGESLTGVAEKYGVTPQDILNWPGNHLNQETLGDFSDPNIEPGTYLVIPGGKRQSTYFAPPTAGSNPIVTKFTGPGMCEDTGDILLGAVGTGNFIWPTDLHYISGYDYSPQSEHYALDLAGDTGDSVYASDSGVVVFEGESIPDYGNLIVIDHGNGWQTAYARLDTIRVGCGENVSQGSQIGMIGSSGSDRVLQGEGGNIVSGSSLHFEIIQDYNENVNPWDYLPDP